MTAPIQGVDVSGWQPDPGRKGAPDWAAAVAWGLRFLLTKASEGRTSTSPAWKQYANAARAGGVLVGAYHFVRWDQARDTAAAQVAHLLDVSGGPRVGDLRPALDLETGGILNRDNWPRAARCEWLVSAVDLVAQAWGATPIIYAGARFAAQELGPSAHDTLGRCPWWRPSYVASEPTTWATRSGTGPYSGRDCEIWQWTGTGRVPWMAGAIDRNLCRDEATLSRLVLQ